MTAIVKIPGAPVLPADAARLVVSLLTESIRTKQAVINHCVGNIIAAADLIAKAMGAGHKLMICGKGGSAGDGQHIAAELVSVLSQDFPRPALPAIALTGGGQGRIDSLVHVAIRAPSVNTQHIQESHIAIGHIICDLVERSLFRKEAD